MIGAAGWGEAILRYSRVAVGGVATIFGLMACAGDRPTSVRIPEGAVLAQAQGGTAPAVTGATPSSAVQDTTIDVTISGSGFARGAAATWSLAGDTSKVHVLSTRYVSSTALVAQINVPSTAPVAKYDVVVTLATGKKGVGAELFAVLLGDPDATLKFPLADAGLGLRSDRALSDGTYSLYSSTVCGIHAKIFFFGTGDAIMDTEDSRYKRKCSAYPRTLTIDYGDGIVQQSGVFMNLHEVQNTIYVIPIGATVLRPMNLRETRCAPLHFRDYKIDGTYLGADQLNVTRLDASSWRVTSQPAPNNRAFCAATGQLHNISVDFIIVTSRPMP